MESLHVYSIQDDMIAIKFSLNKVDCIEVHGQILYPLLSTKGGGC